MAVGYNVYENSGVGDPIDHNSIAATTSGTTITTGGLGPGTWEFGVRAFDVNGEEQNLDCAVTIVLDADGKDITNAPLPPTGLRAFATAGGGIRAEWWNPPRITPDAATGFHVYLGVGTVPDYSSPAATVLYPSGIFNAFQSNLTGLSDGTQYAIGVRAFNAIAEEQNTAAVIVTADATGPSAVISLVGTAIV